MLEIHPISPENELRVAERLRTLVAAAWPDVPDNRADRIDLLVGVRTPADIDILVLLDLDRPRTIPPILRRDGRRSEPRSVQTGLFAIEVKQLDQDDFDILGNQIFPVRGGVSEHRSCAKQAADAVNGLRGFANRSGLHPYVHGLAWLTQVDDAFLRNVEPIVLGREATWFGMLEAATERHVAASELEITKTREAVRGVRRLLLNRRRESTRDRERVESLSRERAGESAVTALGARAGSAQMRLIGRGGSGKTTSLALLAVDLAERGSRVLVLTFHRTLRSDIAHLVASLAARVGVPPEQLHVETMLSFLLSALGELGATIPLAGGDPDYSALDGVLDETRELLVAADADRLRRDDPERFAWDYVFVDECQDCTDAERDFLRALYGHRRLVLADGVDQLVRRQVACNWNAGVPAEDRFEHRLDHSLRMLHNVATYANCFARALGIATWRIAPRPDLSGGRIIVATGAIDHAAVVRAIVTAASRGAADPADCLVCLPPRESGADPVREAILAAGDATGVALWDGTLVDRRANPALERDALRLVRYDSCRGLEGWITVALDLDVFAANRRRHPNFHATDRAIDLDVVVNRSLMIPLTRAVHTLVVTVRDPDSPVAERLRAAADDPAMPRGVVSCVAGTDLPDVLARANFT